MNLWAQIRNRAQVARGPCWQLFPPRTSLGSAPEGLPRLALPPGPHGLPASCWSTREITPTVTKANTSPFQGLSVFNPRPSMHLKYCSASHSSLYRSGRGRAVPVSLSFSLCLASKACLEGHLTAEASNGISPLAGGLLDFKNFIHLLKKKVNMVWTLIHPFSSTSPAGNPLQYSCLENSMSRGTWQVTVHRDIESQTRLSDRATTLAGYQGLYRDAESG